jgi:hypothetical protein
MTDESHETPDKTESSYTVPPLQWDEERDEPFVELEIKGQIYRMTMWRETDGDDMVSHSGVSVDMIVPARRRGLGRCRTDRLRSGIGIIH